VARLTAPAFLRETRFTVDLRGGPLAVHANSALRPRDPVSEDDDVPSQPLRPQPQVTEILEAWKAGDDTALERLLPMVYRELRVIARRHLRGERATHTLQPTALVNEAYLRFQSLRSIQWHDRAHFFAFASRIMRRVLVDHARGRQSAKRGSHAKHVGLTEGLDGMVDPALSSAELIDLDRAMDRLAAENPRLSRLVELRFFGGLTFEEAAQVLECSSRTVKRDWVFARAWLLRELGAVS
jgi:RNA polymerase sigma-70 factor, ECF subfamily